MACAQLCIFLNYRLLRTLFGGGLTHPMGKLRGNLKAALCVRFCGIDHPPPPVDLWRGVGVSNWGSGQTDVREAGRIQRGDSRV